MSGQRAIVIGAGPAGLTAAFELLARTGIHPVVLEMSDSVGGLARTVNYKGNLIDIGGHRFFSKSDRVMAWWLDKMPLENAPARSPAIPYPPAPREAGPARHDTGPEVADQVMLIRRRKSRIYFRGKLFDYPIRINVDTLTKLGLVRTTRIALSYARALLFPKRNPANLEEFLINRFGREMYRTFFQSYTEKVWGKPCTEISAAWGAQRIKGLSIAKTIGHAWKRHLPRAVQGIGQKRTETSLIEQFLYPKYGAGQMWDLVASDVRRRGGEIHGSQRVVRLHVRQDRIVAVDTVNARSKKRETHRGDFFFSTMPIRELIRALETDVPQNVSQVSSGLAYRDFMVVGLLLRQLKAWERTPRGRQPLTDNWIYIHEPAVRSGRLQIFNNWSPYMVADESTTWVGMEYFCNQSDDLWKRSDGQMINLAKEELARIHMADPADVIDGTVVRVPKAYPAYFGTFPRFHEVRDFLDRFWNLFLIGRNGMHKYNNQDHSMLTAMVAVDNILRGRTDKTNLWEVNTEREYHEEKRQGGTP